MTEGVAGRLDPGVSGDLDHGGRLEAEPAAKLGLELVVAGAVLLDGDARDAALERDGEEPGDLRPRDADELRDLGLPQPVGVIDRGGRAEGFVGIGFFLGQGRREGANEGDDPVKLSLEYLCASTFYSTARRAPATPEECSASSTSPSVCSPPP